MASTATPGERELRAWYAKPAPRRRFCSIGKNLRKVFIAEANIGVTEQYEYADLEAACVYLSDRKPGRQARVYCSAAHGDHCVADCKSCHWCRQKLAERLVPCCNPTCDTRWCSPCLWSRYGENASEIGPGRLYPAWVCPVCRNICNCSAENCQRFAKRWPKTGPLVFEAKQLGYTSAAVYLIQTRMVRDEGITPGQVEASVRAFRNQRNQQPSISWLVKHQDGAAVNAQVAVDVRVALPLPSTPRPAPVTESLAGRTLELRQRVVEALPLEENTQAKQLLLSLGMGADCEGDDAVVRADEDDVALLLQQRASQSQRVAPAQTAQYWQAQQDSLAWVSPRGGASMSLGAAAAPSAHANQLVSGMTARQQHPGHEQGVVAAADTPQPFQPSQHHGSDAADWDTVSQYVPGEQHGAVRTRQLAARQSPLGTLDSGGMLVEDMGDSSGAFDVAADGTGAPDGPRPSPVPIRWGHHAGTNHQLVGPHAAAAARPTREGHAAPRIAGHVTLRPLTSDPRPAGPAQHVPLQERPVNVQAAGDQGVPSILGIKPVRGKDNGDQRQGAAAEQQQQVWQEYVANPFAAPQQGAGGGRGGAPAWLNSGGHQAARAAPRQRTAWEAAGGRVPGPFHEPDAKRARTGEGAVGLAAADGIVHAAAAGPGVQYSGSHSGLQAVSVVSAPGSGVQARAGHVPMCDVQPMDTVEGGADNVQATAARAPQPAGHGVQPRPAPLVIPAMFNPAVRAAPQQSPAAGQAVSPVVTPSGRLVGDAGRLADAHPLPQEVVAAGGDTGYAATAAATEPFDLFAAKLGEAKQELLACRRVCENAARTAAEKQHAQERTQEALRLCAWEEVVDLTASLPVALAVNETPWLTAGQPILEETAQHPAAEHLHTCKQLACALELLHLLICEVSDMSVVEQAVRLVFNMEFFVDFHRCDMAARSVLAKWGHYVLRAMRARGTAPALTREATRALMRWVTCMAHEHTALVELLDMGLHPAQRVSVGFLQLAPGRTSASESLGYAGAGFPAQGGRAQGLQGACKAQDERTEQVRMYQESLSELLVRTLSYFPETCVVLGVDAVEVLHPSLVSLLDPSRQVHPDVRHAALQTLAQVVAVARPRHRPDPDTGTDEILQQGAQLSSLLMDKVLRALELLVAVTVQPLRQQAERLQTEAQHPQGLHEYLPNRQTLQEVQLQAHTRVAVGQRLDTTKHKSGRLAKRLLGAVYGVLLWSGRTAWPQLLQQLLIHPQASAGVVFQQTQQPLRAFGISVLTYVVQNLITSPRPHPSIMPHSQLLAPCVIRSWMLSLMDHGYRAEAALLTQHLAATDQVQSLLANAARTINTTPALADALGLSPGPPGSGQPSPAGVPALALLQQGGPQVLAQPSPQHQLCTLDQLLALVEQVAQDGLGDVRAVLLACLVIGSGPGSEQLKMWLEDVEQMWKVGQVASRNSLPWQCTMTVISLRSMRVAQVLGAQGPGGALGVGLPEVIKRLAHRCSRAVCDSCRRLYKHCSGADVIPGLPHLPFTECLKITAASHLDLCMTLLVSLVEPSHLTKSANTQQGHAYAASRSQALSPPPPPHVQLLEFINLTVEAVVDSGNLDADPVVLKDGSGGDGAASVLPGCVLGALMQAVFPPAVSAQGQVGARAAWPMLQWLVGCLMHGLVLAAVDRPAPNRRAELGGLAALQLVQKLLADARMQTDTAMQWLLPPIISNTVAALVVQSPSSTEVLVVLYRLWRQLLPALEARGLLTAPNKEGNFTMRYQSWHGALPLAPHLAKVTAGAVMALCCRTVGTAIELSDDGPHAAQQRLMDLKQRFQGAWHHGDLQSALPVVKSILGPPRPLSSEEQDVLRRGVSDPAGHASMAAPHLLPGDRHFRLLDAQLDFLADLAGRNTLPDECGFIWLAFTLPGLHTVLRAGPSRGVLLTSSIVDRLSRLIEMELRLRRPLVHTQGVPDAAAWASDTLLVPQVLDMPKGTVLQGSVVAVCLTAGKTVDVDGPPASAGPGSSVQQALVTGPQVAAPPGSSGPQSQNEGAANQGQGRTGSEVVGRRQQRRPPPTRLRRLFLFEQQRPTCVSGVSAMSAQPKWIHHDLRVVIQSEALDDRVKGALTKDRSYERLQQGLLRREDLVVVRCSQARVVEEPRRERDAEGREVIQRTRFLHCTEAGSVEINPPDIAPLVAWLKDNALQWLAATRPQVSAPVRPPAASPPVTRGPAQGLAQPAEQAAITGVSNGGPHTNGREVHITQHVPSGTPRTTQVYRAGPRGQ